MKIFHSKIFKILILCLLLLFSNLYLMRSGLWLYQDSSYWYRNSVEAFYALSEQFHVLTNSYYHGFDLGLFNFTRIVVSAFSYFLILIFGSEISQIIFILTGYILSFVSFYFFSTIFIKNKETRFYTSLLYIFNPLMFNLQGFKFLFAGIPLFIFSIYKFFYSGERQIKYLIVNVFSIYIIISYIRFIQIAFFVIVPYLVYLFLREKKKIQIKKILLLLALYLLTLAPIIYSFFFQILEKSKTGFYYGEVFKDFAIKISFSNAFNFFQNSDLPIYDNDIFRVLGVILFSLFLFFLFKNYKKNLSWFFILNLTLLLVSIGFYGFGNILGDSIYLSGIKYLPFITNAPIWALYISVIPVIFLFSLLFRQNKKLFLVGFYLFLILTIFPLLNLNDSKLKKIKKEEVPSSYAKFFLGYDGTLPESTHYIPSLCWRSLFMNELNIATPCFNNGYLFRPISFANPRLLSGIDYYFSEKLLYNSNLDNLRVTHNLKNIVIPNDIVKKLPNTNDLSVGEKELKKISREKRSLQSNINLNLETNPNFNFYSYNQKNEYDFFIYSPLVVVKKDVDNIFDNSVKVDIDSRPVFTDSRLEINQSPKIGYKISSSNPTKYYFQAETKNNKTFILQFNQTFSKNWKIKWITKQDFEKVNCYNTKKYPITNNNRCEFESELLSLSNVYFLNNQGVSENKHQRSNILGNMWIIDPSEIEDKYKSKNQIYGIIIYEKEIYYSWMVLISIATFLSLVLLLFIEILNIRYVNILK